MRRLACRLFTLCSAASLMLCAAMCVLWVRSYWVSETCGSGTSRRDGSDRVLVSVHIWSAKGGVGIFRDEHRNLTTDAGRGSPFYHSTGVMSRYPYISVVAAGVPERRWAWGPFAIARATRTKEDLWIEFDGHRTYLADAQVAWSAVLPWWLPAAACAVLPLLAARQAYTARRGRRRAKAGACPRCGYDLRASPERCPECGKAPGLTR